MPPAAVLVQLVLRGVAVADTADGVAAHPLRNSASNSTAPMRACCSRSAAMVAPTPSRSRPRCVRTQSRLRVVPGAPPGSLTTSADSSERGRICPKLGKARLDERADQLDARARELQQSAAQPAPEPGPEPEPEPEPASDCHPSYDPCLPIVSDVDCVGGSGDGPEYTGQVSVVGPDEYDLDRDGDGVGCD
jgi:hypothetical protein